MRSLASVIVFVVISSALLAQTAPAPAVHPAVAEDPASREQVLEYIQLMELRKQFDAMIPILQQQVKQTAASLQEEFPDMDEEDAMFLANEQQVLIAGIFKRIDIPAIEEAIIPIYQRHFTRPEMDAILVFYESPVGRKMRAELPAMMGEMMQIMRSQMEPISKDLVREMRSRLEEHMKAKKARQSQSPQ